MKTPSALTTSPCALRIWQPRISSHRFSGFHVIWAAQDVGSDKSSMDTVVVQRGEAKIALMQGETKAEVPDLRVRRQIRRGCPAYCLEVDDIDAVCREWKPRRQIQRRHQRWQRRLRAPGDSASPIPLPRMRPVPGIDPSGSTVEKNPKRSYAPPSRRCIGTSRQDQHRGITRTIVDYETPLPLPNG